MNTTSRALIPVLTSALLAGCSAGVEQLPLPAPGLHGSTYELTAEFTNALNLPDRAKVRVGGADVGEVVGMTAHNYVAVVQMRILDGIRLPKGTVAELRSATPLGDVFVSLKPPAPGFPVSGLLRGGDVIPRESTNAAATVEQVLATTSLLVNGGVIRNLTRVLNGVGGAVGKDGNGLASLIRESRALVSTMADRSDEIRSVLQQTSTLADELNARRDTIDDVLDSSGPALLTIADNTSAIVELVNQLGAVTNQLKKFPAIQGTDTRSWIHDLDTLSAAFSNTVTDPRVSMANFIRVLPAALKIFGSNAAAADVDLQQLALGHIADKNHYADPGFTGPKWADWDNMVGSVRFVISQLGNRVWGPDRGRIWGAASMSVGATLNPLSANIIRVVRAAVSRRLLLSCLGQLALVVIGVAYLIFGALRVDPLQGQITVKVQLPESGGLLAGQDVTVRGIPVGRVTAVDVTADGVLATARLVSTARIPLSNTTVRVSALSPAGEQYLDFTPHRTGGPFISDGTLITRDRTQTPVPLWRLLTNVDGVLAQADPGQIRSVITELGVSEQGPQKLADLLNGTQLLLSTLDGALPQTMTLLRSSRTVFRIIDDASAGLHRTSANLAATLGGVGDKDAGIRQLLHQTPAVLKTVDRIIDQNSPTMVQLLGNLATVAQLSYVRVPALDRLFNDQRQPMLDSVTSLMHGGAIWAIADVYPRPVCDYPHPRDVPFIPNYPEPFMYSYCKDNDPGLLVRGARNAPRPPGDDTAAPPKDLDPLRRTDPTPVTGHTIPLPYGGPQLPPESQPILQGSQY